MAYCQLPQFNYTLCSAVLCILANTVHKAYELQCTAASFESARLLLALSNAICEQKAH